MITRRLREEEGERGPLYKEMLDWLISLSQHESFAPLSLTQLAKRVVANMQKKKKVERHHFGFVGKLTTVVSPTADQLWLIRSQIFLSLLQQLYSFQTTSFTFKFFSLLLNPDLDCPLIPAVTFALLSRVVYRHTCFCSPHLFEGGSPTKRPLSFPADRLPSADVSATEKKATRSASKSHWDQENICAVYLQLPPSFRGPPAVLCKDSAACRVV